MKKLLLVGILLAGSITTSLAAEWYEGGTLHQSTMAQWSKGSEADKLATCADWVSKLYNEDKYNSEIMNAINTFGMASIKEMSNGCVSLLDAASGA